MTNTTGEIGGSTKAAAMVGEAQELGGREGLPREGGGTWGG